MAEEPESGVGTPTPFKVAISGSHGLIGSYLIPLLKGVPIDASFITTILIWSMLSVKTREDRCDSEGGNSRSGVYDLFCSDSTCRIEGRPVLVARLLRTASLTQEKPTGENSWPLGLTGEGGKQEGKNEAEDPPSSLTVAIPQGYQGNLCSLILLLSYLQVFFIASSAF